MPQYRDDDGNIHEEPTRRTGENGSAQGDDRAPTRKLDRTAPIGGDVPYPGSGNNPTLKVPPGDDPTRRVDRGQTPSDPTTKFYRPRRKDRVAEEHGEIRPDHMDDPIAGWLVVTAGPGRGASASLGYGMNDIGRSGEARVSLPYGDELISRTNHATVTYDPRGRKWYLAHGGGKSLTYLDDGPVLAPVELSPRQVISLGETQLTFVPFCDQDFDRD